MSGGRHFDLLGMLWYHGSMQQREAENYLQACTEELDIKDGKSCYFMREHRGNLYLSAKSSDMCHHIAIHRASSAKGYSLEGHHNVFGTLAELILHHQQFAVYVDGGEFLLQICCRKEYVAYSLNNINDFKGACILQICENSIVIKKSNGSIIGTWQYKFIREFRFDDEKKTFQFTSGRRGPFGLANYIFDLHDRIYYNIRETVNRIARGSDAAQSIADGDQGIRNGSGDRHENAGVNVGDGGCNGREVTRSQLEHQISGEHTGGRECDAPPVPPHRGGKVNNGHHTVISITKQHSASIPDLRYGLPHTRLNSSVKSNISHPSTSYSQRDRSTSYSFSVREESSEREYSEVNIDYDVPRSAAVSDYQTPRCYDDPMHEYQTPRRHDDPMHEYQTPRLFDSSHEYQVPNPIEQTYVVPRRGGWSRLDQPARKGRKLRVIEHNYEDLDGFTA